MNYKLKIKDLVAKYFEKDVLKYEIIETGVNIFFQESESGISSLEFEDIENFIKSQKENLHLKIEAVAQEEILNQDGKIKVQKIKIIAFETSDMLQEYLNQQEELKKYDHRVLGKQMELFEILPISPGSIFWLKNGYALYNNLKNLIRQKSYNIFNEVKTPYVMSNELWKTSGHLEVFKKNMMFLNFGTNTEESCALKPMNCPGHIELFKKQIRSYKDLPYRIGEFGCCHRYEPSGALFGLMRVRSFVIDDGHIFCTKEQIKNEIKIFVLNALELYKKFTFNNIKIIISTKPENALGNNDDWVYAEHTLQEAMKENNIEYVIAEGEGAFYGPKIEIHVEDSMKRNWQLGTIQLDFVLPERFDINFINNRGEKERPCMLHRAALGSIERFIGLLLEHTKGNLPLFIHPNPIVICSVNTKVEEYAKKIQKELKDLNIKSELDIRDISLSNKIKEHKLKKTPILIVLGEKEMRDSSITLEYNQKKIHYNIMELKEIKKLFDEA